MSLIIFFIIFLIKLMHRLLGYKPLLKLLFLHKVVTAVALVASLPLLFIDKATWELLPEYLIILLFVILKVLPPHDWLRHYRSLHWVEVLMHLVFNNHVVVVHVLVVLSLHVPSLLFLKLYLTGYKQFWFTVDFVYVLLPLFFYLFEQIVICFGLVLVREVSWSLLNYNVLTFVFYSLTFGFLFKLIDLI